jgi:lactoylglutathione lyase/glyoxylase I family protein
MIKTLAHVCILSRDLQKTLDFYCGILNLQKKFDFVKQGRLFGFYLQIDPHHFIEVFAVGDSKSPFAQGSITHLCLEVDDLDSLRNRLIEKGISVTDKALGADQSWQFWCKDPDNTALEFHQYTEKSSQLTGATCDVNW